MSDGWEIYQDADDRWRWKYIMQGRTVAQARVAHERQSTCVAEARVHGYREDVTAMRRSSPAHEDRAQGKKR